VTAELARGRTLIATHSAQFGGLLQNPAFGSLSLESIIYGPRRMAFSPVYVSHMYEPAALRDCDSRACSQSHSHCRKPPFSREGSRCPRARTIPQLRPTCAGSGFGPPCCLAPAPKQGTFGPPEVDRTDTGRGTPCNHDYYVKPI
jgi:hypothetical protein